MNAQEIHEPEIEQPISSTEQEIEWRRNKVIELASQGRTQREISTILQVSVGTVNADIQYLRREAKSNIRKHIEETIPFEYEKCLAALESVKKQAFDIAGETKEERTKIQALSLAKECIVEKMDLLTNVEVVDDAVKFVESAKKRAEKGNSNDSKESKTENQPVEQYNTTY